MEADRANVQQLLAQRELDATAANIRAQAASGQIEQLARTHRQEIEQERQRAASIAAKAELTAALAKQSLVPHSVEQLTAILALRTLPPQSIHDREMTVRSKDYRDVSTYVESKLSDPSYAHFRSDKQPPAPVNKPAPNTPELPTDVPTLGHAFIANHLAKQQAQSAGKEGLSPLQDMSQGIGGFRQPRINAGLWPLTFFDRAAGSPCQGHGPRWRFTLS